MGERLIGGDVAIETAKGLDSTRFSEAGGMEIYQSTIRPGYFATLRIPLLRGRDFKSSDYVGSTPVVIVSQRFAERAWPGEDPIGKRVRVEGALRSVVGVAREALTNGLRERARPMVYLAQRQQPRTMDLTLLVRARGDAAQLASSIRAEILALDRNVPVFGVQTLAQNRSDRMLESRIGTLLLGIFGGLSLSLAAVGIYAVMAFTVGHRRREIGVRIALGAVEREVVSLFVRRGLRVTVVGTVIGLALAGIMAKVLSTVFLGVSTTDAIPFAAVTLLLGGVATLASWIPARRAARVDPVNALRSE
jgi:predicted permease